MSLPRWLRVTLRLSTVLILAFIYLPIGIIVLYSFNAAKVATWPITSFTLDWYFKAFNDEGIRSSFATSVQVAIGATILAVVLGSLLALAVARFRFFGRESIAFIVILPLALPGIVTGLALNTAFRAMHDFETGIVYVNAGTTGAETHLPFGGWKETGNGHREAGHAALDTYTEWKSIYVDFSGHLQRAQIDNQE